MLSERLIEAKSTPEIDTFYTPLRFSLLLGLAIFVAFPKVALGIESFFYRDFGVLAYPTIFYHRECFWRGELPLWNPLSNCGAPFLAQWGTMVLYPFSLLYLLFPLPWSANFFCLVHLFWAGLGTYILASKWTGNRFAASVAGFAFAFNGVTFSCLLWPNYVVALGWMPWVIWIVQQSWQKSGRHVIPAAAVASLQVLSGAPELVILTWLLLFGLSLCALAERTISPLELASRLSAVVILVTGLTAVQLWPFWDLLRHSQRDQTFATAKWSMPVSGLANLLVPLFHCSRTSQGIYFQLGQQFLSSTYLGISVLALALFTMIFIRNRNTLLLSGLAVFSFGFAIGENGFFYRSLKQLLPFIGFARYPIKCIILAALILPLLAAYALSEMDIRSRQEKNEVQRLAVAIWILIMISIGTILFSALAHPAPTDQWSVILWSGLSRGVVVSLAMLLVVWRNRTNAAPSWLRETALLALIVADTLSHMPRQNPSLAASSMTPALWQAALHQNPPKPEFSRVMITPIAEEVLLQSGVQDFSKDFFGKRLALWSHLNLLDGIAKVNGSSTLQIREQARVQSALYASTNTYPRLLDFLSVSHISSENNAVAWVPRTEWLPIITVGQQPIFAEPVETMAALTNANFNPSRTVYLPTEASSVVRATNAVMANILRQNFSRQRIEVEIESDQGTLAVVAQSIYPAWRAFIDRNEARLWRANYAFQAVEIPRGRHQLLLEYRDQHFTYGVILCAGTCLLCIVLWTQLDRRKRRMDSANVTDNFTQAKPASQPRT